MVDRRHRRHLKAVSGIAEPFLDQVRSRGSHRIAGNPIARRYAANFVVIAGVTPIVEELMFRGAGYSLLGPLRPDRRDAPGLVHGLIEALVVLTAFGIGLAWLRATDSVSVHGRALAVQRRQRSSSR